MNPELKRRIYVLEKIVRGIPALRIYRRDTLPREATGPGIYVLSEAEHYLYVGRANSIRTRLQQHSRPSSNNNTASFAFRLAKEACGVGAASYTTNGSRKDIDTETTFQKAFADAKERVREMDVRFALEVDSVSQALLEICVAVELNARYNDFDNH